MNFSEEVEQDPCISFLDILISRNQNTNSFVTSIYRKPTFCGIYLNFRSYTPMIYKKKALLVVFRKGHYTYAVIGVSFMKKLITSNECCYLINILQLS